MTMSQGSSQAILFALALDSVPKPFVLTDPRGDVEFVNRRFSDMTGFGAGDFERQPLFSLLRPRVALNVDLQEVVTWKGEVEFALASGQVIPLFLEIQRMIDADGVPQGFFFLFHPVEAYSENYDPRVRHHHKLELLGSFAGGVVHDLNNILTGVLGHLTFLRNSLPEIGPHSESLIAVEEGARRAASTTQQILEFARGEHEPFAVVSLNSVVASCVTLLRSTLPANVMISVGEGPQEIFVHGDESQLGQVLLNLAINARDAMPNGGRIDVQLDCVVYEGPSGLPGGEYARLVVTDNGRGIPAGLADRIFEPFFTTKDSAGTGLGLSNVYSIVQAHKGTVFVDSELGRGSRFEVLLPLAQDARPHEQEHAEGESLPTGTGRILVIEDEEIVRTVIQRSLEHLGYVVDVAEGGREGIALFETKKGAYDLVILDMMMPDMPGDSVFFRLKELRDDVPVLIASGYSSDSRTRTLLESGARGFIQKPFGVEELAWEVKRHIGNPPAGQER